MLCGYLCSSSRGRPRPVVRVPHSPPRPKSPSQRTSSAVATTTWGNKEMSFAACVGNVASSTRPSVRPSLQSHVSSDNGISRGHSLSSSSSSSFLSLRFEKFVLALRDSSKFVIFLLPPSSPCSASEWGVGDHLPRGGGYSFAVTRASLDTNCSGVPRMPRVPKT